jgi:TetR/AcrR family transcriptional regulator
MKSHAGKSSVKSRYTRAATRSGEPPKVPTRERILAAAETLFATHTFTGTQVGTIAATAGVNKRLIYHYFGDKSQLYGAVLHRVHRRWTTFDYFKDAPKDPLEFIDGFVVWSFEKYRDDPNFVRLIAGENFHGGTHFEIASPSPFTRLLLTTMTEVIQRGQLQGVIREDLDPIHLVADIIGLCFFNFSNAYTMSRTLETDLRRPDVLHQRLQHIRDVIRRTVVKLPAASHPGRDASGRPEAVAAPGSRGRK